MSKEEITKKVIDLVKALGADVSEESARLIAEILIIESGYEAKDGGSD